MFPMGRGVLRPDWLLSGIVFGASCTGPALKITAGSHSVPRVVSGSVRVPVLGEVAPKPDQSLKMNGAWHCAAFFANILFSSLSSFQTKKHFSDYVHKMQLQLFIYKYLLQTHSTENLKKIFLEMKLRGLFPNFYIPVSISDRGNI